MRTKFYFSLFIAFIIIAVNHYANQYDFYWILPWFDIPMHIAGGMMVGFFGLTFIDYFNISKINKHKVFFVILFTIAVGIGWEFTEWYFDVTDGLSTVSRFDTIKDVIDDIIGGLIAVSLWRVLFQKTNKHG